MEGGAQLIMVRGTSWIAKKIQEATGSPYSHCGFVFGDKTYEADMGGVQSRYLPDYPWAYDLYKIEGVTDDPITSQVLEQWCHDRLGKSYDYLGVLLAGVDILLHQFHIRSISRGRMAYTCAAFCYDGLASCRHRLWPSSLPRTPALMVTSPKVTLIKGAVPRHIEVVV